MSIWEQTEKVKSIIAESKTRSQVITTLGLPVGTSAYQRLKKFEYIHNVNISHYESHFRPEHKRPTPRILSNADMFCINSTVSRSSVKRRILQQQLIEYKCRDCNNSGNWNNKNIVLQLEHTNGIHNDNRLENLCFLCPNCHSQTPTFCGGNLKKINKKPQLQSRDKYLKHKMTTSEQRNKPLVNAILTSTINFQEVGWSNQVAKLLNKRPQKVKTWMVRYMPNFYKSCFHTKDVV